MLQFIIQYWEILIVAIAIIIELLARVLDNSKQPSVEFEYKKMPVLRPIKIPTEGRGVVAAFRVWLLKTRQWAVVEDFHYSLNGKEYIIEAGFRFDGASIPKFLHTLLSPTGILLLGGLIHDHGYRYQCLRLSEGKLDTKRTRKYFDKTFRDINIQVNGFKSINYASYFALRAFGFFAWKKQRKD